MSRFLDLFTRASHLVTSGRGHRQIDVMMTRRSASPPEVAETRHGTNCCTSRNWIRPSYAKFDRRTALRAA
jgi:hypothetical protein